MSIQTARASRFQSRTESVPMIEGESRRVAADFSAVIDSDEIGNASWTVEDAAIAGISAPVIADGGRTALVTLEARCPGITRLWCRAETVAGAVRVQEFVVEVACGARGTTVTVSA